MNIFSLYIYILIFISLKVKKLSTHPDGPIYILISGESIKGTAV